jgi:hypothetical protein
MYLNRFWTNPHLTRLLDLHDQDQDLGVSFRQAPVKERTYFKLNIHNRLVELFTKLQVSPGLKAP